MINEIYVRYVDNGSGLQDPTTSAYDMSQDPTKAVLTVDLGQDSDNLLDEYTWVEVLTSTDLASLVEAGTWVIKDQDDVVIEDFTLPAIIAQVGISKNDVATIEADIAANLAAQAIIDAAQDSNLTATQGEVDALETVVAANEVAQGLVDTAQQADIDALESTLNQLQMDAKIPLPVNVENSPAFTANDVFSPAIPDQVIVFPSAGKVNMSMTFKMLADNGRRYFHTLNITATDSNGVEVLNKDQPGQLNASGVESDVKFEESFDVPADSLTFKFSMRIIKPTETISCLGVDGTITAA